MVKLIQKYVICLFWCYLAKWNCYVHFSTVDLRNGDQNGCHYKLYFSWVVLFVPLLLEWHPFFWRWNEPFVRTFTLLVLKSQHLKKYTKQTIFLSVCSSAPSIWSGLAFRLVLLFLLPHYVQFCTQSEKNLQFYWQRNSMENIKKTFNTNTTTERANEVITLLYIFIDINTRWV